MFLELAIPNTTHQVLADPKSGKRLMNPKKSWMLTAWRLSGHGMTRKVLTTKPEPSSLVIIKKIGLMALFGTIPQQLTSKLCFLLVICGFTRPSDIERIDESRTASSLDSVKFTVVEPKEKRMGFSINKTVYISSHRIDYLCPVSAYREYITKIVKEAFITPKEHRRNTKKKIVY
ncbi:hypothetical protein AX774_g6982 [Zancudomyces culisetae]|uniref:Uncharacterized protein n=1 Tax=Zancudomyces culisetae TaxID=1213189 RepID=A0A1R1PF95_ZANCU|nr:hypothetical protein AX774_g6982 [Zancudomyces culisetae]|eukprot:OMH79599.1 hypothetical protein AX774_g6982 [Zancudomyces culisetae]